MADPFIGAGIGAVGNLVGGLIRDSASNVANERAADMAANNIALQKEFAQAGMTWKARDIMRAYGETGIHPLAMLGMSGSSFSPVSAAFVGDSAVGEGIQKSGQDISRAISASASDEGRKALHALALQRGGLENELLRVQIARQVQELHNNVGPGMPLGVRSAVPTTGDINFPGVEKKIIDDVTVTRTPRGGYVTMPSEAAQQRMSEMFGLGPEWFARNRAWLASEEARQWVKKFLPAPPYATEWKYNAPTGEWLPSPLEYTDRHMFRDFGKRAADRFYKYGY